jgi:hypothetical protein
MKNRFSVFCNDSHGSVYYLKDDKTGQRTRLYTTDNALANRYSAQFVRQLHSVLDRGLVSVRKAADLLECEPYDLTEIVSAYGFDPSF